MRPAVSRARALPLLLALALVLAPQAMRAQGGRGPDIPVRLPGELPVTTAWKDEHRARVLGTLVPGLGHFYAEETGEARGLFTAWTAGIFGCTAAMFMAPDAQNPSSTYAIGGLLGAIGIGAWVWSAIDAPRAARRTNARRVIHRGSSFRPLIQTAPGGVTRAGLMLSL